MKSKKWLVVTLISLLIIVLEVVALFVFILPGKYKSDVFKSLVNGDGVEAEESYDKLSSKNKEKVEELMDDFLTYECNEYIDGKITFDSLYKTLDAVNKIDDLNGIQKTFVTFAVSSEINRLVEAAYSDAVNSGKTSIYSTYSEKIRDIYYSDGVDITAVNEELVKYIDDKYAQFSDGKMSFEDISKFVEVGIEMYPGDAFYHLSDLSTMLRHISAYQEAYDIAKGYYDQKMYFETIVECENVGLDNNDKTGFFEKFSALKKDAYDAGKTYYLDEVKKLADEKKTDEARKIIDKIKEVYGGDVDTAEVEKLIVEPWMSAYVEYMKKMEKNLKADMAAGVKVGDCDDSTTINVDDRMPDKIFLYDFDGDDTPELLLSSGTYYYIIGFNGKKAVLMGFVQIAALADKPYLITIPTVLTGDQKGYALVKVDNCQLLVENWYYAEGRDYNVNGQSTDYETCKSTYDEISAHENKSLKIDYGNYIDKYEELIYNYGK